jgi:hypothetical protein
MYTDCISGSLGRWEVEAHIELSVKVIIEVGIFMFEVLCRNR